MNLSTTARTLLALALGLAASQAACATTSPSRSAAGTTPTPHQTDPSPPTAPATELRIAPSETAAATASLIGSVLTTEGGQALPPATPAPPEPEPEPTHCGAVGPTCSGALPNGLHNPMPGGVMVGYRADTGLDIAGYLRPVYAIGSGHLDYSEAGHTRWPRASQYTVRLELDEPIPHEGRLITHVWYAHLSQIEIEHAEGDRPRPHVQAGQRLGVSGFAGGSPHLHLGLLLDGEVDQYWGTFLLEDACREVLGGYQHHQRLPPQ